MTYIEQNLMADERLVHQTRIHPIILLKPFLGLCILTMGLRLVHGSKPLFYVIGVLAILSLIRLIVAFVFFRGSEYGITSKRVLGKTGFITRSSLDIVLTKVEAVRLNQDLQGRIFDYGTIEVTGSGGTEEELVLIPCPLAFRKKLQEQVVLAQETMLRQGQGILLD
jgi:uncharacterized membrane protein YdbT with pleckstrin-like domain